MLFEDRILEILKIIQENGSIENSELLKVLNISEATLRRDLTYLEKENKIKRVRGGAIANNIVKNEISIKEKINNQESKRKIAKIAEQFISNGDYIYLDAGTTTYELIDYMKDKNVKVVTNGISNLEKQKTLAIVGTKALRDLSEFSFDKAFIGINGINENGFSTHDVEEAILKRQAINNSNKVYILADHSKFDMTYFSNIAKLEEATIITHKKEINPKIKKRTKIINE